MVKEPPLYSSEPVNSPEAAVRLMSETLRGYDREVLAVVNLRNDLRPINMNIVSIGTLNQSLAHPREIMKSIILSNAGSVMLFHNHPSGNLTPSQEDISLTDRMSKICSLMGTPIVDHIIIGNDDRYYSFRENCILQVPQLEYARDASDLHLGVDSVSEPGSKKSKQTISEITDKLEQGVHDLFESEKYKAYLSSMSKFHNYSLNNTILICMQKPDATLVAGYQAWRKNHGRQVKRGEKGIKIIAPSPYKIKTERDVIDPKTQQAVLDKDGKPKKETVEIERPSFRVVTVFDVSQTEGKELPTLGTAELTGSVDGYNKFLKALEKTSPVPIGFEEIGGSAKGYFHTEENRIAIQEGMSEIQTVKTMIHEMAHATLHSGKDKEGVDARTREVQAESVAYTVCQHYGIETSDYSFGYIAGWSSGKETAELKASLETIRSTASDMINQIDGHLLDLQKEKSQDRESVVETVLSAETGASARAAEQKTADKEKALPKKSVCAELKASKKQKSTQVKKHPSKSRGEEL
jgi:antirestriction protein ArdC/proteasome lid subunit RPN8/RPN11